MLSIGLSIGHGWNWKNVYVGQRRRRRYRGIMYFRNIATFVSLLLARSRRNKERPRAQEKGPRRKKKNSVTQKSDL